MDTQKFYRRVETIKIILLSAILLVAILIYVDLPKSPTVRDMKTRNVSANDLPVVVVKGGRIELENEELKVRGNVTIENQPIEVREEKTSTSRYRW